MVKEEIFQNLANSWRRLRLWRQDNNHVRQYFSLGGLTPAARRALEKDGGATPDALAITEYPDYQPAELSI